MSAAAPWLLLRRPRVVVAQACGAGGSLCSEPIGNSEHVEYRMTRGSSHAKADARARLSR
jgi:hypothetical protein